MQRLINPAGVPLETYAYDEQGRLVRSTDPLGASPHTAYDIAGRPARITDRAARVTRLSYDERGQLVRIERPKHTVELQHDAAGRLAQLSDNISRIHWHYDAADRIVRVDTATGAGSHRLDYAWDSLDRLSRRTFSGASLALPEVTDFQWDVAGRLLAHTTTQGGRSHATSKVVVPPAPDAA